MVYNLSMLKYKKLHKNKDIVAVSSERCSYESKRYSDTFSWNSVLLGRYYVF